MELTMKKTSVPDTAYDETNTSMYEINLNRIEFQPLVPLEGIETELKWTFPIHICFFALSFFILTFYTLTSIINIRSQISRKRFVSGINTFLCIFSISRAVSLFADPYGSRKNLPSSITDVLWAIGYPSLMSSFSLLQLAFLHLTKLNYGAKILRIEIFLRSVITLHIFSSVMRAIISSVHWSPNMVVINYVFEVVFLSWALFMYSSFLYIGYQVFGLLKRVPATMLQPDGCQNKVIKRLVYVLGRTASAFDPPVTLVAFVVFLNNGIMQLVMLAPASNLVTSVTAALMPTLLGTAAGVTSNRTPTTGLPTKSESSSITAATIIEKANPQAKINLASSSCSVRPAPSVIGRLKNTDGLKPEIGSLRRDGTFNKTKKLTWQSSITNDSRSESILTGTKIVPSKVSVCPSAGKRPILKDANKIETLNEVDVTNNIESIETTKALPTSSATADIDDKASAKENDLLLHTILNHIAYVNRASGATDSGFSHYSHTATPTSRKKQLCFVLKITYSTAILGFCLTLAEFFQRFGPYGLMRYLLNDDRIQPWPWFTFQTFCRACELFMGGAIAKITQEPAASIHRYYKHNPAIMKQRESMFM